MNEGGKIVEVKTEDAQNRSLSVFGLTPQQLADFDTDKLEKLLQMHKEHQAEQARLAFFKALHALREEMTPVAKRGFNKHTVSKYAKLEDILGMLNPLFNKHGFAPSLSAQKSDKPDHTLFVLILRHVDGHFEEHCLDAPIDYAGSKGGANKTKIQGLGSSATYCFRYLIDGVLGVQTVEDDDGNAAGGVGPGSEGISEEQIEKLEELIAEKMKDSSSFFEHFEITLLSELPVSQYKEAVALLNARKVR